jgi:chromatin remodeling complex protein RSC6
MDDIVYFRFNALNPTIIEIGITRNITSEANIIFSGISTKNSLVTINSFKRILSECEKLILPPNIFTNNSGKAYECLMRAYTSSVESVKHESVKHESVKHESVKHESVKHEPVYPDLNSLEIPTTLSDELCKFLGVPTDTKLSRLDITIEIAKYIKENNLKSKVRPRGFCTDEVLYELLGPLHDQDRESGYSFDNLQRYITPHLNITKDNQIIIPEPVTHEPVTHEPVTHEPVNHDPFSNLKRKKMCYTHLGEPFILNYLVDENDIVYNNFGVRIGYRMVDNYGNYWFSNDGSFAIYKSEVLCDGTKRYTDTLGKHYWYSTSLEAYVGDYKEDRP